MGTEKFIVVVIVIRQDNGDCRDNESIGSSKHHWESRAKPSLQESVYSSNKKQSTDQLSLFHLKPKQGNDQRNHTNNIKLWKSGREKYQVALHCHHPSKERLLKEWSQKFQASLGNAEILKRWPQLQ